MKSRRGFRFAEFCYFYEIANHRSIRKAAEFLHVSPSALSRQVQNIEYALGTPVIERGSEGVRLTIAGELLLQHIKESFSNEERLLARLDEIDGLQRGCVRVASGDGFLTDLLGPALEQFARQFPGVDLEITLAGSDGIKKMIVEEEAELGIMFAPPADPRILTLSRHCQPLHAIVSPYHVLAQRKSLSLPEISEHPLALLAPSHGIRQVLSSVAHELNIHLRPRFLSNSIQAAKMFAERYDALTVLPHFSVISELAMQRLVSIPLRERGFQITEVGLITKTGRDLPRAVTELSQALDSGMQAFQG